MATLLDLEDARKVCYRFLNIPAESRFILRVFPGEGELTENSVRRSMYYRFNIGIETLSERCSELYAIFVQMRLAGKKLPMALLCLNVHGAPYIVEEDPEDFLIPVTRTGRLSGKVPSYGGLAGQKRALANLRSRLPRMK